MFRDSRGYEVFRQGAGHIQDHQICGTSKKTWEKSVARIQKAVHIIIRNLVYPIDSTNIKETVLRIATIMETICSLESIWNFLLFSEIRNTEDINYRGTNGLDLSHLMNSINEICWQSGCVSKRKRKIHLEKTLNSLI